MVLCNSVFSAIFSDDWQQFLNMVFFMVLQPAPTSKPLILNSKDSLFTIEWNEGLMCTPDKGALGHSVSHKLVRVDWRTS